MSSSDSVRDRSVTRLVGFYSIVLMSLYNLAVIGLISVPVQFVLKDRLHLPPDALSKFGFFTDAPYFVAFAFGFLRDRWRPLGKGDRLYFLAVPILMAVVYVWMALQPATYASLLIGIIATSALGALLGAAAQGLLAALGKDFGMMGRLAAIALITARGSFIYNASLGGWLGEHTNPQFPFFASAAVCLTMLVMAFWRPRSIFRSGDEVFVSVIPEGAWQATKRLLRHKAVYLPAIVLFLWEFAPGWGTPLLYYLTNTIKLSESAFGASQGYLRLGTVLAALAYPWLCTRVRFKPLLLWGTFLGVLGGPLFLLIHSPGMANAVNFVAGITCGLALAAYYDLLVRCCPAELEGVAFMLSFGALTLATDTSDIFGSWLYEKGGFGLALGITTLTTASIFVPLLFLPRSISNPHEGERMVDPDPPVETGELVTA